MMRSNITVLILLIGIYFQLGCCYSAFEDARIINEYKQQQRINATTVDKELNHAKIARQLVHQAIWASVGTISVNNAIKDYPMVNIISVNDNNVVGQSTGHIQFFLTDLDFTGPDWQQNNKVTILFTDEQLLHCTSRAFLNDDPMEPTCARTILSGQISKMDKTSKDYDGAVTAFVQRHPAAKKWLNAHTFYLCELNITNIYVLDYYGGPHTVSTTDYYNVNL